MKEEKIIEKEKCICDINGAESDIGHFKECPRYNDPIKVFTKNKEEIEKSDKFWNIHNFPETKGARNIYKHIVYNPYMGGIQRVIKDAQDEKNLNGGLEWQFVRTQSITEYAWV